MPAPCVLAGVHVSTRGNKFLAAKDLAGALAAYTEAISLDGSDAAFRSNRSVVYMSMGEHEKALLDAEVGSVSCLQEAHDTMLLFYCLPLDNDRDQQVQSTF